MAADDVRSRESRALRMPSHARPAAPPHEWLTGGQLARKLGPLGHLDTQVDAGACARGGEVCVWGREGRGREGWLG